MGAILQVTAIKNHIVTFPPILCRILAKHRYGSPLSTHELATRLGWTPAKVEAFSQSTSWRGIDVFDMLAFMAACQLDFSNHAQVKRVKTYLRGKKRNGSRVAPTYMYLRRSPLWQSYYLPLVKRWAESVSNQTNQSQ